MRGIIFAILFVLLVIFVILATERRERHRKTGAQNLPADTPADAACKSCQLVEQCDKKAEPQSCSEPAYFDDEELDSFRGRASDSYTEQEVALFREIIESMQPDEISEWHQSLTQRGIQLPDALQQHTDRNPQQA